MLLHKVPGYFFLSYYLCITHVAYCKL